MLHVGAILFSPPRSTVAEPHLIKHLINFLTIIRNQNQIKMIKCMYILFFYIIISNTCSTIKNNNNRILSKILTHLDSRFRKSELDGQSFSSRYVRILASQKRSFQSFQLLRRERGPASPLFSRDHNARFRRYVQVASPSCAKTVNYYYNVIVRSKYYGIRKRLCKHAVL